MRTADALAWGSGGQACSKLYAQCLLVSINHRKAMNGDPCFIRAQFRLQADSQLGLDSLS
ncbi:uncharacterized protein P174DRAFT_138612 [Aspergillus novofumigatus IBT 16806]|uniref:Uncharacterized protein n=1 Tax=Aspergillus novofumigatus (strain IBT 16806) TaxID=1392255 RepID=A0A2I1CDE3_ASPN1|nr:uncharacterized protein P174DRAFT_138612 [Aspergillus novofumigatus IBT 16806]PKX95639.1 hypothetical protein P174DRAFT_138612 [Aspergillus novofumigatus IBT 16806]